MAARAAAPLVTPRAASSSPRASAGEGRDAGPLRSPPGDGGGGGGGCVGDGRGPQSAARPGEASAMVGGGRVRCARRAAAAPLVVVLGGGGEGGRPLLDGGRGRGGGVGVRRIPAGCGHVLCRYAAAYAALCALLCCWAGAEAGPAECDRWTCVNGRCADSSSSSSSSSSSTSSSPTGEQQQQQPQCVCDQGWMGELCQHCGGRFKLTEPVGVITDGPSHYKYKTKCSWLIQGAKNVELRLRFNHFATECSWDHMYVFDGDSIYAPLLAVFSGLIVPENRVNESIPEVVARSGSAFLHFFSDAAYNLTGFNISYSFNSCPNNCSGHGRCNSSGGAHCVCDEFWKGGACDVPYCGDNCGSPVRGFCDLPGKKCCMCNSSWQGPDCSVTVPANESYWMLLDDEYSGIARASHKAVVHNGSMWIVGGYAFNYSGFPMVLSYDLKTNTWPALKRIEIPFYPRYGHSLSLHGDNLYMYGGKIETPGGSVTDELWVFHVPNQTWSHQVPSPGTPRGQFAAVGHSAHVATLDTGEVVMFVFFGHNPTYGYLSKVQEYNIKTNSWRIPDTNGALVLGGYGQSSVYDSLGRAVFVHGGFKAFSMNRNSLTDDLYRFDVNTRTWTILTSSGLCRYLHSAVIISGTMLVYGGNTHNDTSVSTGAKCFSADFMAYDIACDEWSVLPKPDLHTDTDRFGHTAVAHNGSMYIFGGFDSLLLQDLLVYTPLSCEVFSERERCEGARPGLRCVWNSTRCLPVGSEYGIGTHNVTCPQKRAATEKVCSMFKDCGSCTSNLASCQWCSGACTPLESNCTVEPVINFSQCQVRAEDTCAKLPSCLGCVNDSICQWESKNQHCMAVPVFKLAHAADHMCGDGWDRVAESCYKINTSVVNYDNARMDCISHNGIPASLTTAKEVEHVLAKLALMTNELMPWVGLRGLNVSHWRWEDGAAFTNSTLVWEANEPSGSGFCAVLSPPSQAGRLKAYTCTELTRGSVCEKPVVNPNQNARQCRMPCAARRTCAECASGSTDCMWCSNAKRCVDANAYVPSFPYGQCMEWHTMNACPPENCSGYRTCAGCMEQPGCGWCNDPSDTGKGQCMEGSATAPVTVNGTRATLNTSMCREDRSFTWNFITCPDCQCNGHSTCVNATVCEHCSDLTMGKHCETCSPGYYGDPTNGGSCQGCKCNHHATDCNAQTGKCYCTTKGIKGDQCQLCDIDNRYLGNPLKGTCYYSLLIDYQFTFSLSLEDDKHYTSINFMATPEESNRDLDMFINTSKNVNLNITWSSGSTAGTMMGEEVLIVSKAQIREYKSSFSNEKFDFRGNPNITFYVYVSNFTWPVKIQIAFSQHSNFMDLVQFFITFFSCFLSLLLVAAVVWKIKQSCWATRRREQLMREMQQMASRPFASVDVALESEEEPPDLIGGSIKTIPQPIAMEPCAGNRAAIYSVLVRLPRGLNACPPPGQSGLALASALVDISHYKPSESKEKAAAVRNRKHHPPAQPGTCV
ncbi:attractin isoform X3 [Lampetra fluviatilis]